MLTPMQRTPIPTEYKGVRYESKSEAIFACCLDLAGKKFISQHKHAGHVWDFVVLNPNTDEGNYRYAYKDWYAANNTIVPLLVEYKPSAPTQTYVDNLTRMTSVSPHESIIVWGSPYKTLFEVYHAFPVFTRWGKYGWGDFCKEADNNTMSSCRHQVDEMLGITDTIANAAKQHRYDLT